MNAQNRCPPVLTSCISTSVDLGLVTVSGHNPLYGCHGEEVEFQCEVTNGASLEWVSEPDICRNHPISYTGFSRAGQIRTRGSYRSQLVSVARDPPNTNFSSVLMFIPSSSVNSVTVVCGDKLSSCRKTEKKRTLAITGKYLIILNAYLVNIQG